jgi:ferric-dicitrate binding protein FerR (iron transport regulator)
MSESSGPPQDALARLVHVAGRRETPPAQAYERALAAASEVWRTKLRRRRRRTAFTLAASIAALTVGAVIAVRSLDSPTPAAEPIAQIARVIGAVRIRTNFASDWTELHEDTGLLPAGTTIRTDAASKLALQVDDVSVRIASNAEIVLDSRSQLRLVRGKVYVDTGAASGPGRMSVITGAGAVSDVGTQFEVQYDRAGYHVRVREGEVLLRHDARRQRGHAGEQLSIDASGAIRSTPISPDDPAWRWVHALASAPDVDNQPLAVVVAWVERETGVTVRYATPAIERRAMTTILHGSIRNLEPLEALSVMLATTDLQHEVLADGTIMIK